MVTHTTHYLERRGGNHSGNYFSRLDFNPNIINPNTINPNIIKRLITFKVLSIITTKTVCIFKYLLIC